MIPRAMSARLLRRQSWLDTIQWRAELTAFDGVQPVRLVAPARTSFLPVGAQLLLGAAVVVFAPFLGGWGHAPLGWLLALAVVGAMWAGADFFAGFVALVVTANEILQVRRTAVRRKWRVVSRCPFDPRRLVPFSIPGLPTLHLLGDLPRRPFVDRRTMRALQALDSAVSAEQG